MNLILNERIFNEKLKKYIFFKKRFFYLEEFPKTYEELLNEFRPFKMDLKEIEKIYNRNSKKFSRALKRINYIMKNYNNVYFCTFTFNDESIKDYKKNITKFKKKLSKFCYIGNIDYGTQNDRVHYHFVIGTPEEIRELPWNYGFYNIKKCNNNSKALSNYIIKLSYHSFKETNKLIYSRINKQS